MIDLKANCDRDGFTVIRGFLAADEFVVLQHNLDRYVREVVPSLPDTEAFYEDRSRPDTLKQLQRMDGDQFFSHYKHHVRWVGLAEALLDEPAVAEPPEWFNKPPGTNHVTPPHQDNYYFCLTPPSVLTIWLALDRVDTENGCLRYVLGSHLRGLRPHARSNVLGFSQGITNYSADDFIRERPIMLEAGDAVAHYGMTIHRADANHSTSRQRRSFAMVFKGASCRRDDDAHARYLASARQQHQAFGLNT
jgi:ectoine hydroxylase-related dioxygenase (phytanoyl-CoA dioxygenase family)